MKKILFKSFLSASFTAAFLSCTPAIPEKRDTETILKDLTQNVREEKARQYLTYLASDEMAGRDTPSPELERAAEYIADRFKEFGVEPINGTYMQPYNLQRTYLSEPNMLTFFKNGERVSMEIKDDFIPFDITGSGNISGAKIVFVGYGITAPEYKYDDYENVDVRGKVVMVLRGEPQMNDSASIFNGRQWTRYGWMNSKVRTAAKNGAIGFMYINDPVTSARLKPVGFPWPSLYKSMVAAEMPLTLELKDSPKIPVVHVGERTAEQLFGSVEALKSLQLGIDNSLKKASYELSNITVNLQVTTRQEKVLVKNVAGIIRGSGNTDEYVVIGAHYDHVGHHAGQPGEKDTIYNGADDNASGTTGIILIAEAFSKIKERPKRNIVLVAFSGEEKGLYGSRAYVENSPLPIGNCVAMINMDMIGRNHPDSVSIGGQSRSLQLAEINEAENQAFSKPFILNYNIEDFFFRSDQANFARKRIPVLFYFTGEHEDYHKVGDHVEKINFTKLTQITRLASRVVWRVAEMEGRLLYVPQGGEE
ncbi:MAG TPA: M20/M25/M40 family metallo-hydrolase [Patescibacteria group bacterium]|nr:M20/M25/M40 family metallo-hydrolase [Patescibacteria group bacterium]